MTGSSSGPRSRRDLEKRIDALEGEGEVQAQEVPDLSLSVEEKEASERAFDVDPATMKQV